MESTKHEKEVLIYLYRKYSKDEEWSFLIRVCKERGEEIGVLKSEIEELKYNLLLKQNKVKNENNVVKVEINYLLKEIDFNEEDIDNCTSVSVLNEYNTQLVKIKNIYGKKHWYISNLFSHINTRLSFLKRNTRPFSEFMVDIIREKFTEEEFRDLIQEAYKKECDFIIKNKHHEIK